MKILVDEMPNKVEVFKTFSADIIEEMTEVVKHESEG